MTRGLHMAVRCCPWQPRVAVGAGCAFALLAALISTGCDREERNFTSAPSSAEAPQTTQPASDIRPGTRSPLGDEYGGPPGSAKSAEANPLANFLQDNAYTMSSGQTLYAMMNCAGCHANGGGDKGPPLNDDKWIYGSSPQQVYDSIVFGRPGGMPSFRGRLPDSSIWQIVTYVRSMSGLSKMTAANGRQDHMQVSLPPNSTPKPKAIETEPPAGPTTSEARP